MFISGASRALSKVSMGADIGTVTCVLGRKGVVKTSPIRAIAGLQPIEARSVAFDGQDLAKLSTSDRARPGVALVPQGREIFAQLTVEENLKTGYACLPRATRHIPDEIFELFSVLKNMLGRCGGDLSGGHNNNSPSPARSSPNRACCCLMNQPKAFNLRSSKISNA